MQAPGHLGFSLSWLFPLHVHYSFSTTWPVDFSLQHRIQKQQAHINCLNKFPTIKPLFDSRPTGSASLDPTLPGTQGTVFRVRETLSCPLLQSPHLLLLPREVLMESSFHMRREEKLFLLEQDCLPPPLLTFSPHFEGTVYSVVRNQLING